MEPSYAQTMPLAETQRRQRVPSCGKSLEWTLIQIPPSSKSLWSRSLCAFIAGTLPSPRTKWTK